MGPPPIREELARWIPAEQIADALEVFRRSFVSEGLAHLRPMPGALELAGRLREGGGRLVVITSRIPSIARACLEAVGLRADVLVGDVSGQQKAEPMREHCVHAYVGDHPLDMLGAAAAGVVGIGVSAGTHSQEQLLRAGAIEACDSLTWLLTALS